MSQTDALLLFSGRGVSVVLTDHPGDLQVHADALAAAADGALAGAEALASDWSNNRDEILGAVGAARALMQLSRAASGATKASAE